MGVSEAGIREWSGSGDGTATVFIHGAGSDHEVWLPLIEQLRDHRSDLYAVDLPGHGHTPGPALGSIEEMSRWLVSLMSRLELPRVALVGHSMGSLVAFECAASVSETVERVVLVATSDRMAVNSLLQRAADARDPLAIEMILQWSFTGDAVQSARREAVDAARTKLAASLRGVLGADLRACHEYDPVARAAQVGCPALVIGGSRDLMTPAEAGRRLAESIPDAEFALLGGAGHNTLAEDPGPMAQLVGAFLDS